MYPVRVWKAVLRIRIGFYSDPGSTSVYIRIRIQDVKVRRERKSNLNKSFKLYLYRYMIYHNNLQLVPVPVPLKNMTKYLRNTVLCFSFKTGKIMDAVSGSASSMQIRIQGTSHNADPCKSRSATQLEGHYSPERIP